ncbi:MAG: hypothetical protein WD065_02025 [Planctomycetaceae bacterium]
MYSPSTGRFDTLDPFYGNLQDPQSFHKYGYVHGDPVNMVDPTGMFSVAGMVSSIGNIGAQIGQSASTAYRIYQLAERVQGMVSMFELAWELTNGIPGLQREIRKVLQDVHDLGPMAATFSSITMSDIVDAFEQIGRDLLPEIAPTIARTHGDRVTKALLSREGPISRQDTLVLYAPTPHGSFHIDSKLIRVPGVRIAGMNVEVAIGGGGGRLFGFGVAKSKTLRSSPNESYMLLRVDWHSSSFRHPPPYAKYFTTSSGFDLHWQIPENKKEARSHWSA